MPPGFTISTSKLGLDSISGAYNDYSLLTTFAIFKLVQSKTKRISLGMKWKDLDIYLGNNLCYQIEYNLITDPSSLN